MSRQTDIGAGRQGDALLWVAAAVVIGVAAAWLALAKPWASAPTTADPLGTPLQATVDTSAQADTLAPNDNENLGDPLRLARLAYDAGMLMEPADYSAWTLYERALQRDPRNAAAAEGLHRVADALLARSDVALEQGRHADAEALIERILSAFPDHERAVELAAAIESRLRPREEPEPPPAPRPAPASVTAGTRPPPPAQQDPMEMLRERFDAAMQANRLLAPAGDSARDLVSEMLELDAGHALSAEARRALFDRLLLRATEAVETLDTQAADTWIDAAEELAVDAEAVTAARGALIARLAAMEAARPIPSSELTVVHYAPPQYPSRALERGVEGWVDIEFVVATDGSTRDITVANASHATHFHTEAVRAVEQWRFEPRSFMDRPIEQRSHTRIRFTLQD